MLIFTGHSIPPCLYFVGQFLDILSQENTAEEVGVSTADSCQHPTCPAFSHSLSLSLLPCHPLYPSPFCTHHCPSNWHSTDLTACKRHHSNLLSHFSLSDNVFADSGNFSPPLPPSSYVGNVPSQVSLCRFSFCFCRSAE